MTIYVGEGCAGDVVGDAVAVQVPWRCNRPPKVEGDFAPPTARFSGDGAADQAAVPAHRAGSGLGPWSSMTTTACPEAVMPLRSAMALVRSWLEDTDRRFCANQSDH